MNIRKGDAQGRRAEERTWKEQATNRDNNGADGNLQGERSG